MGWIIDGNIIPDEDSPIQSSIMPKKGALVWAELDFLGSDVREATGAQRLGRKSPKGVLNFHCSTATRDILEALEGETFTIEPPSSIDPDSSNWLMQTFECYDWTSSVPWAPDKHIVTCTLLARAAA